ncbi:MAG: hypothetical protein AB1540_00820 [Bdellovibrionota bacterium]
MFQGCLTRSGIRTADLQKDAVRGDYEFIISRGETGYPRTTKFEIKTAGNSKKHSKSFKYCLDAARDAYNKMVQTISKRDLDAIHAVVQSRLGSYQGTLFPIGKAKFRPENTTFQRQVEFKISEENASELGSTAYKISFRDDSAASKILWETNYGDSKYKDGITFQIDRPNE